MRRLRCPPSSAPRPTPSTPPNGCGCWHLTRPHCADTWTPLRPKRIGRPSPTLRRWWSASFRATPSSLLLLAPTPPCSSTRRPGGGSWPRQDHLPGLRVLEQGGVGAKSSSEDGVARNEADHHLRSVGEGRPIRFGRKGVHVSAQ